MGPDGVGAEPADSWARWETAQRHGEASPPSLSHLEFCSEDTVASVLNEGRIFPSPSSTAWKLGLGDPPCAQRVCLCLLVMLGFQVSPNVETQPEPHAHGAQHPQKEAWQRPHLRKLSPTWCLRSCSVLLVAMQRKSKATTIRNHSWR